MTRVLIVDDHRNTRESLVVSLPLYGCQADGVADTDEALLQVQARAYDWIVSDVRMPGPSGVKLAQILRQRFPQLGLILMTAHELTLEETAIALALGIVLLIKPVTAEMLAAYCAQAPGPLRPRRRDDARRLP